MPVRVDLTEEQNGGVMKEILSEGKTDEYAPYSSTVHLHYHGTLSDGSVFDSSRDRGVEFSFTLGIGQVIKAWDMCVASMKIGEKSRLVCKPEYAYGDKGAPPNIPPNSTLTFDIELFRWTPEDISPGRDGSILRKVLQRGDLFSSPKDMAECAIHLRGSVDGKLFEERDVTFVIGEAPVAKVCKGVALAVQKMKKGEQCEITLRDPYTTERLTECLPPDLEGKVITYIVTLHSFEQPKECWEMNLQEKFEEGEKSKDKGTLHLRACRMEESVKYYNRTCELMRGESRLKDENKKRRDNLLLSALLNAALVNLKLANNALVISQCTEALTLDEKNIKALFRRGQAQMELNEFDLSMKDFKRCLEIEPDNRAAASQLNVVRFKLCKSSEKERKMFRQMFQSSSDSSSSTPSATTPSATTPSSTIPPATTTSQTTEPTETTAATTTSGKEASGDGKQTSEKSKKDEEMDQ